MYDGIMDFDCEINLKKNVIRVSYVARFSVTCAIAIDVTDLSESP